MSMMCSMDGCKAKKGLCLHEKLMMMVAVVAMAAAGAHWGLHLI